MPLYCPTTIKGIVLTKPLIRVLFMMMLALVVVLHGPVLAGDRVPVSPTHEALIAEIDTHLLTPCLRAVFDDLLARSGLADRYTAHELFLTIPKARQEEFAFNVLRNALPLLHGVPQADRLAWYRISLRQCIGLGLHHFSVEELLEHLDHVKRGTRKE